MTNKKTKLDLWSVKYFVKGIGEQTEGPWLFDEAVDQLKDIRGYDGVTRASLVPFEEAAS